MVNLGKLVLTLYGAEAFFVVVVFGAIATVTRVPVRRFIRYVREPFLLAFSTASSESAFPLALENMERFRRPQAHCRLRSLPGTASIWMGRLCIFRSRPYSWRRLQVFTCRSQRSS